MIVAKVSSVSDLFIFRYYSKKLVRFFYQSSQLLTTQLIITHLKFCVAQIIMLSSLAFPSFFFSNI